MPTRVVIVDDHRIVRQGLRRALADADVEVVGEAANGLDALDVVPELEPDVVLMDLSMPGIDGVEATRRLRRLAPRAAVVVLTMHGETELVERARAAGAVSYLVKGAGVDEVIAAIEGAMEGRHVLSLPHPDDQPVVDPELGSGPARRGFTGPPSTAGGGGLLTPRQLEIMQLIADGASTAQCAEALSITPKTVRNHLTRIYEALGVDSRSQAVVEAIKHRLVELR